jgi:hypothetical protein
LTDPLSMRVNRFRKIMGTGKDTVPDMHGTNGFRLKTDQTGSAE